MKTITKLSRLKAALGNKNIKTMKEGLVKLGSSKWLKGIFDKYGIEEYQVEMEDNEIFYENEAAIEYHLPDEIYIELWKELENTGTLVNYVNEEHTSGMYYDKDYRISENKELYSQLGFSEVICYTSGPFSFVMLGKSEDNKVNVLCVVFNEGAI